VGGRRSGASAATISAPRDADHGRNLIALPASLSARRRWSQQRLICSAGYSPCASNAPTISGLRNVVRVTRQRWRNEGLTAGRHAGSPVRVARPRRVLAASGNASGGPRVRRPK